MKGLSHSYIADICKKHSLLHIGVTDITPPSSRRRSYYSNWINAGLHGEMKYLAAHAPLKYSPQDLLTGAKSLIQVLLPYYRPRRYPQLPQGQGRITRYAWGRDYHKVLKKRLSAVCGDLVQQFPGEKFRPFVDSGPLDERYYAQRARLGQVGRNGLLIHPEYGSWVFLGEIVSTLSIDSVSEGPQGPKKSEFPDTRTFERGGLCPPGCENCKRACPTGALGSEGVFDARLCISYLTIEYKGSIEESLRPLIGDWLFGCDMCQDVCPLNRNVPDTGEGDFLRDIAGESIDLSRILRVRTHEDMVEMLAGSPLMRLGVSQLLRNASIVAANTGAGFLIPELKKLTLYDDPIVREHASWAIEELS